MSKLTDKLITEAQVRAASSVLEDYADELPSLSEIASDIYRDITTLQLECFVTPSKKESNVIYVLYEGHSYAADAILEVYERAYPEVKILVGKRS